MKHKPELTDFTPRTLQIDIGASVAYWYFGTLVYVPEGIKWLAMEDSGHVFGYIRKPQKEGEGFKTEAGSMLLADFSLIAPHSWCSSNWFNSRIKVKKLVPFRCYAP